MQVKNKVENVLKRNQEYILTVWGKCGDEVKNVKGYSVVSQLRATAEFK